MKEIIKKLDKITFHDVPVKSINIICDPVQSIVLSLLLYNEASQGYDNIAIIFKAIEAFEIGNVSLDAVSDMDLYRFEYKFEAQFVGKLIFNLGIGKGVVMEVVCKELELLENTSAIL